MVLTFHVPDPNSTQKTIFKRQLIHYTIYQKSVIWKLLQKIRSYLVLLGQIT
jgi:hypothetical protein